MPRPYTLSFPDLSDSQVVQLHLGGHEQVEHGGEESLEEANLAHLPVELLIDLTEDGHNPALFGQFRQEQGECLEFARIDTC